MLILTDQRRLPEAGPSGLGRLYDDDSLKYFMPRLVYMIDREPNGRPLEPSGRGAPVAICVLRPTVRLKDPQNKYLDVTVVG